MEEILADDTLDEGLKYEALAVKVKELWSYITIVAPRERICSLFGQYSCRVCRGGELRFVSGLLESALADEYGFDGPFMASSQTYSLFQSEGCCAVL